MNPPKYSSVINVTVVPNVTAVTDIIFQISQTDNHIKKSNVLTALNYEKMVCKPTASIFSTIWFYYNSSEN